jgi:GxxExxY protein
MKTKDDLNYLGGVIPDSAITVHKEMGPGLLESVYHECLWEELVSREVYLQSNVSVPLVYKGKNLKKDYIIDLLVEDEIVIELKAIDGVLPVHQAQISSAISADKDCALYNHPRSHRLIGSFINEDDATRDSVFAIAIDK